jgi:N-acetylmuramoyl-L-alanine amidase
LTTLDNGIVIGEAINAHNFTAASDVPDVFQCGPRVVTGVTIHHWGDDGQKFDDVLDYLASDNARGSSAHIVLQEDRVECIVNTDDAAWHAGNALGNTITIGIECRPEMTPGDLETLESVIRFLESVYGELLIYKHSDWINTACPGRYGSAIDDIVAGINNVSVAPAPVEIPAHAPEHVCCCH